MEDRQNTLQNLKIKKAFEKAGENLKAKLEQNPDFDPLALFEWGSAMGMAVLELLKAVEQKFGQEGQQLCREVLVETGRKITAEALKEAEIPPEMTPVELVSLMATWVNTRFYASMEDPRIINDGECNFDIIWCLCHENSGYNGKVEPVEQAEAFYCNYKQEYDGKGKLLEFMKA